MLRGAGLAVAAALVAGCLDVPDSIDDGGGDAGDGVTGWTLISADDPAVPAVWAPRLIYDPERQQVVMYGGEDGDGPTAGFYAWDGARWETLCEACPPGARYGHGLAYDPVGQRILLYGGVDGADAFRGDLWQFDDGAWTEVDDTGDVPGALASMWFGFDPEADAVRMYGGERGAGFTSEVRTLTGDTWTLDEVAAGPGARADGAASGAVLDGVGLLVFGDGDLDRDDLWALDDTGWTQLCADCTGAPRTSTAVAVDPRRELVLLIGGFPGDDTEIGTTFEVERTGAVVRAFGGLPPREGAGAAYDEQRGVFVLYGGNGVGCGETDCGDTFEYRPPAPR